MPKPKPGQARDDFVAECVPVVIDDGTANTPAQAVAICNSIWEQEHNMSTNHNDALIGKLANRRTRNEFGYGLTTADRYVRNALGTVGDASLLKSDDVDLALKEAARKLSHCSPEMLIEAKATSSAKFKDVLPKGIEAPANTLMVFRHVLTSSRKDRDNDVLVSSGAKIDPKAPLLWQHMHTMPLGKVLAVVEQNDDVLKVATALLNLNDLTHDAALLIEADALRFSHGFRALEFEELKADDEEEPGGDDVGMPGFKILRFEILEASLVSIPSNVDAEIELFSRKQLKSLAFQRHAKHYHDARPAQVAGSNVEVAAGGQLTLKLGDAEVKVKVGKPGKGKSVIHICDHCGKEYVDDPLVVPGCPCQFPSNKRKANAKPTVRSVKGFEPAQEHLEASQLEYDWAAKFLGCEIKDLIVTGTFVSRIRAGSYFTGEKTLQADWVKADQRNLTHDGKQEPLRHEVIQLNSRRSDTFMIEGLEFWKLPDGRKLVVKHAKTWGGYDVLTYAKEDDGSDFTEKCWLWAKQNNFLRGEAFSLTGKFIDRPQLTLDDVFLEAENKNVLTRAAKQMNEQGADMPSRGVIMAGPPGTGKTLSGRILLNEIDATFIWVSARDFWQTGSTSGICRAFDMAAELAPCVIFYEDVDNWIAGHATDLMKTEMDGLDRRDGILTILTTNYPDALPAELIDRPGRFHDVCQFDLPSKDVRLTMLLAWSGEQDAKQLKPIVDDTDGYSGAHMFELCKFAEVLRSEDEQLTIPGALTKAIEKIDKQRALIDESQLAGSRYRPGRRSYADAVKGIKGADKYERYLERLAERIGPSPTMNQFTAIVEDTDETVDTSAQKRGRTLSARNLQVLKDVRDDVQELSEMELTRAGKALCERCVKRLDDIIDAATDDEAPSEAEPSSDEGKSLSEQAIEAIIEADAVAVLGYKNAVLARIGQLALEQKTDQYRKLRDHYLRED